MNREELEALMNAPYGASRMAGAALKPDGGHGRRKDPRPAGYPAPPGSGPDGETCRTCRHLVHVVHAKSYPKCGKFSANWTGGRKTDVLVRSPACRMWEPELDEGVPCKV